MEQNEKEINDLRHAPAIHPLNLTFVSYEMHGVPLTLFFFPEIIGGENTPYYGGIFKVDIQIPDR